MKTISIHNLYTEENIAISDAGRRRTMQVIHRVVET